MTTKNNTDPKKGLINNKTNSRNEFEADWLLSSLFDTAIKIRDRYGKIVSISFHQPLPDGTFLTDEVNAKLSDPIRKVIFAMRTGKHATVTSALAQAKTAYVLFYFCHWMSMNKIHRFRYLTPNDINEFLESASQGIEKCLKVETRIQAALTKLSNQVDLNTVELSAKYVFAEANLNVSLTTKCPISVEIIKYFNQTHIVRSLPAGSDGKSIQLAQSAIFQIGKSIQRLWDLRNVIGNEALQFDPFPDGLRSISKELGKVNGRTKTPPIKQSIYLIEHACNWVINIGPALLDLRDDLDKIQHARPSSTITRVERINRFNKLAKSNNFEGILCSRDNDLDKQIISVRKAINGFIPLACAIVICAFTSRRHEEVTQLEVRAIQGNREDGWWLHSIIEKTLKRKDYTPCPEIVVLAVALLERWSSPSRAKVGSNKLFLVPVYAGKKRFTVDFGFDYHIDDFCHFIKLPLVDVVDQQPLWHFAPHQFRRFFAILYVWKYSEGDLGALSHHMRHFDIEMTRRYVTDVEMGRMISEYQAEFTIDKHLSIAHGDAKPSGPTGQLIQNHINRLRKQLDVVTEQDLNRKIERAVIQQGLVLRATPFGFCSNRGRGPELRRAKCLQIEDHTRLTLVDGLPDPAGSNEEICMGCLFHMIDQARSSKMEPEIQKLISAIESSDTNPLIRAALQERLQTLTRYANMHQEVRK